MATADKTVVMATTDKTIVTATADKTVVMTTHDKLASRFVRSPINKPPSSPRTGIARSCESLAGRGPRKRFRMTLHPVSQMWTMFGTDLLGSREKSTSLITMFLWRIFMSFQGSYLFCIQNGEYSDVIHSYTCLLIMHHNLGNVQLLKCFCGAGQTRKLNAQIFIYSGHFAHLIFVDCHDPQKTF